MKKVFIILGSLVASAGVNAANIPSPQLQSTAWSPDLTKSDIRTIRKASFYLRQYMNKQALPLLKPYIEDPRNIEPRYLYAVALAKFNLPKALAMLKPLTQEGYPHAMATYGEKRTCELKKYHKACQTEGYDKLLSDTQDNWAKTDPYEFYNAAYEEFSKKTWTQKLNAERTWYNKKTEDLLKTCTAQGVYKCAYNLQGIYTSIKHLTAKQYNAYQYYLDLAKQILISDNKLGQKPSEDCYQEDQRKAWDVCLSDKQNQQLLTNYAINGDVIGYSDLSFFIYGKEYKKIHKDFYFFSDYLINPNAAGIPKQLKKLYDHAMKLNDGLGWAYPRNDWSIKAWEDLYGDKNLKEFNKQVNKLRSVSDY